MSTSKKQDKDGASRKRGRPEERIAMTGEQAGAALDRMFGKKPTPPEPATGERVPVVRSKRPKPGAL
ncbi:MAG: hypothetical protein IPJ77_24440 [Planctomycetes bacterium]|nr:hypothetical protein [Planctomycetota bacterium]